MIGFEEARRYAEAVERVFGATEVVPPGIILELDRPEWGIYKREFRYSLYVSQPGVAVERAYLALANPAASQRVVVLESVHGGTAIAANPPSIRLQTLLAGAILSTSGLSVDRRVPLLSVAAIIRGSTAAAGVGGTTIALPAIEATDATDRYVKWTVPVVLAPGTNVALVGSADNTALSLSWSWRERPARPEELAQ